MSEFQEPREIIPLVPEARDMLASEPHRLHHAAWHDIRGQWLRISDGKRDAIRALGWKPGHSVERPAVRNGSPIVDNGSGEDFLFMHREMIGMVQDIYKSAGQPPITGWSLIQAPGGDPANGFDIPPNWKQTDQTTARRLEVLKSDAFYWTSMRAADRQFKNAAYLSSLSLGALGAILEFTIHNDMHMRWASQPRDPATGEPVEQRDPTDFDPRWSNPVYDFLGEFYSSHVNPVFWRLHGWVDDRVEDWFTAHELAHAGEVERATIDGLSWFKPGRWVSPERPWARPDDGHGGHPHHSPGHGGPDPEVMKEVIRILYREDGVQLNEFLEGPARVLRHPTWFLT